MHLFGSLIPNWLDKIALIALVALGGYQAVYNGLRKFKSDNYGKFDSQIGSITEMYTLLFAIMFFLKGRALNMVIYYGLNVLLFLLCSTLVPAFILAKGKYNYKSILGESDKYEELMYKVKDRRQYSLIGIIILIPLVRILIQLYFDYSVIFKILGFVSLAVSVVVSYFYRQNQKLLGKGKSNSKPVENKPKEN